MQLISDSALDVVLSLHIMISATAESHLNDKTNILLEWVETNDKEFNSLYRYVINYGYMISFIKICC